MIRNASKKTDLQVHLKVYTTVPEISRRNTKSTKQQERQRKKTKREKRKEKVELLVKAKCIENDEGNFTTVGTIFNEGN